MEKILVIDDEKEISDMLTDFLSPRGYNVISAANGEEGLKKFDSEAPNIVICDIKMPVKDGFQFLKELRDSRKWVPVIILTALTEPASILKGYDLQADYYITKPIDLNEMLKAIQIMLSLAPLRKA
ncbi:MAG: response regulator [Candidatus Omnitrophica bacterium]|nr:response regulator [Candidatus Omnitrophota bacterium]MCM8790191.1 response regulator [Candidatus Omnitrophota bacterium]